MAADKTVDDLSNKLSASATVGPSVAEDEKSLVVTRKHTRTLDQADGAVVVEAPGYEDLIAKEEWTELGLKPELLKGVENLKWGKPSKIQAQVLAYLNLPDRPNIIAQSKNGSGKTGAFGLFILSSIDTSVKSPQAIILTTTRELCLETTDRIQKMADYMSPKPEIAAVMGGMTYSMNISAQVIVATPARLAGLIKERKVNTSKITLMVFDEADDTLINFYGPANEIRKFLKRETLQVMLFSASFFYLDPKNAASKDGIAFTNTMLDVPRKKDPIRILVQDVAGLRNKNVTHFVARVPEASGDAALTAKAEFLASVYNLMTASKTIVFCNTHKAVEKVAEQLRAKGYTPAVVTGAKDVTNETRARVLKEFESGITKVLVTTLYEKGIDIPSLKLVINFDLPVEFDQVAKRFTNNAKKESFQHRCGRVGRFGTIGSCIHLVANKNDEHVLGELANFFKLRMHLLPGDVESAAEYIENSLTEPLAVELEDATSAPAPAPAAPLAGAGITASMSWGDVALKS